LQKISAALLAWVWLPMAVTAAEPAPSLVLSDAWVRALPPGQPNTAAYLTATNSGASAVIIVAASADIADAVEMHTTREVDGYQRMERLQEVPVAPGQSVIFAPGGKHLMLLGLERMPAPGEQVRLCLALAGGGEACTTATVRKSPGADTHEHHQH
jgi:copper(I)-binding protein